MGLINLLTDLTSFQYYTSKGYPGDGSKTGMKSIPQGHDRRDDGSSNQPYIQTSIPDQIEDRALSYDFILRGGANAVKDSLIDVKRLGKYFIDLKSPSGLLFVAKQNLLSRISVRTQASTGILNEGIYTPLSTLAEAGLVAFGGHVNKQGLNPFSGLLSAGTSTPNQYADTVKIGSDRTANAGDDRLIRIYSSIINNDSSIVNKTRYNPNDAGVDIISYPGGPGSILGIGSTHIRFADQRTGLNNPLRLSEPARFYGKPSNQRIADVYYTLEGEQQLIPDDPYQNLKRFLGLSIYPSIYDGLLKNNYLENNIIPNIISPSIKITTIKGTSDTYTQQQLIYIPTATTSSGESFLIRDIKLGPATPGDFRRVLKEQIAAPNYTKLNIEQRVNLGNPGTIGKPKSYTSGSKGFGSASGESFDIINASALYQSEGPQSTNNPNPDAVNNDLVKFRIGVIDNNTPSKKTYIHFRAFLDQISDSYNADWQATKYIGRGENFYTYNGFDRKVSLSWTVAAQSKAELIPMYKRLNYLASVCAPDYSSFGYMRGNIVTLTIGGYFYEQPGIITGLNYEMNDGDSSWEIGINDEGASDTSVKELPHLIKVTGFNFIPIHNFVPRLQQNKYGVAGLDTGDNSKYGLERYIALTAGGSDSYINNTEIKKLEPKGIGSIPVPNIDMIPLRR